jgi:hypothetical protein
MQYTKRGIRNLVLPGNEAVYTKRGIRNLVLQGNKGMHTKRGIRNLMLKEYKKVCITMKKDKGKHLIKTAVGCN